MSLYLFGKNFRNYGPATFFLSLESIHEILLKSKLLNWQKSLKIVLRETERKEGRRG